MCFTSTSNTQQYVEMFHVKTTLLADLIRSIFWQYLGSCVCHLEEHSLQYLLCF